MRLSDADTIRFLVGCFLGFLNLHPITYGLPAGLFASPELSHCLCWPYKLRDLGSPQGHGHEKAIEEVSGWLTSRL